MTPADGLPSVHDPTVAAAQPNAMVNDAGDVFYPDSPEDAALFVAWHDARPANPGFPLWAGTEPQDPPDPDWDDLTRADLAELAGQPAADLADTLDEWLHRCHGILSGTHNAGLFAELLAAKGWRVQRIDPGPPFNELLPASID